MELRAPALALPLRHMAVDTLAAVAVAESHILVDDALGKRLQAALVQCQFFVHHIRRPDKPIGDVRVDAVGHHGVGHSVEMVPAAVLAHVDVSEERVAHGGLQQLMPAVGVDIGGLSAHHQLFATVCAEAGYVRLALLLNLKVQRCYVGRQDGVVVVGRDHGIASGLVGLVGDGGGAGESKEER